MLIKDLVVTGLVKLIRHATIRELVVEAVNQVTKEEIDTLKGVKSNIQEQLSTITNVVDTAKTEQTTWKSAIANAINRIKRNPNNEGLSDNSALSVFVSHIGNIEHGPDVSGVTATADDVMNGKKIVDSSGNIVTGTIVSIPSNTILKSDGTCILSSYYDGNQWVSCDEQTVLWLLLPINGYVYKNRPLCFPLSNFGGDTDATHVIKGKTFTSKSGYKITGTMPDRSGQSDMTNSPVYGYFEQGTSGYINGYYGCRIPYGYYGQYFDDGTTDVRIEAFAFNEKIGLSADKLKYGCTIGGVYGTFTHDANADARHIVKGRTAYVKGAKVTGTLQEIPDYFYFPGATLSFREGRTSYGAIDGTNKTIEPTNFISVYYMNDDVDNDGNYANPGFCVPSGSSDEIMILASRLGNASAGDARKGKTFTSENGLKITGTMNEIKDYFYHPNASLQMRTRTSYTDDNGVTKNISSTKFLTVYAGTTGFMTGINNEIMILASRLGNASAADVLSGKTFTSENGLKITGTIASKSSGTSSTEVAQAERTDYLEVTIPAGYYPSGCKLHVPGFQLASDWKSGYIKACGFRCSKVISAGESATITWSSTLPYYEICAMADASGMGFFNVRTVLCGEHAVNHSSTNYFLKLNSTSNCNTDVAILSDFVGGTVDGVWTYTASGWVAMSKFEVVTPVLVYIRLIINESCMKLEVHNKSNSSEITVSLNRTMFLAYAQ